MASLLDVYPFTLIVISDYPVEGLDSRIQWVSGISYKEFANFEDESIDLCIIDTDHNFWTLAEELKALEFKMREGGLIAMHDVETFYHNTGMALSYSTGEPYPKKEIEKMACYGSLGDALIEFLLAKKLTYKLMAFTPASHGAAVIERRTQMTFDILVPGVQPEYANKGVTTCSV